MKKARIILVLISLYSINTFSQEQKIDSASIAFKAKLFTVSEFGSSTKEQILSDISNQDLTFLDTMYKNFLFMKISFSQPYRLPNNHTQTLYRYCDYYLAFSVKNSRYYKLGGFDSIDIDAFFKDLKLREGFVFKDFAEGGREISGIDIYCLHDYYKIKKCKRIKKSYTCFENCKDITETTIIQH